MAFVSALADEKSIETLKASSSKPGFIGVDVLVSAHWPAGVLKDSPVQPVRVMLDGDG